MNQLLIDKFIILVKMITDQINTSTTTKEKIRNRFRLKSIKHAIKVIKEFPDEIKSGQDLKYVNGIGKGIMTRVDEIIKTGTMEDIKKYKKDPKSGIIKELKKVIGIGPVNAVKLINEYNIKSVKDLKKRQNKIPLIHSIKLGLKYYDDSLKRIPRNEITKIYHIMRDKIEEIDKDIVIKIAGSYRRKLSTSGDIDILVTHKKKRLHRKILKQIIDLFSKSQKGLKIIDHLTEDITTKYMGFIKYKKNPVRRIDIRFIPQKSWYPALLYFTGNKNFNIYIRKIALKKGYKINEYGIFKRKEKINVNSEQEIFELLGIKYLKPSDRNM